MSVNKGLTRFIAPVGSIVSATEASTKLPLSTSTVVEVKVNVSSNTMNGLPGTGTTDITLRKNGVDTSTVVTIAAGATGIFKSLITAPFADDDLLSYKIVTTTSTSGSITIDQIITNIGL